MPAYIRAMIFCIRDGGRSRVLVGVMCAVNGPFSVDTQSPPAHDEECRVVAVTPKYASRKTPLTALKTLSRSRAPAIPVHREWHCDLWLEVKSWGSPAPNVQSAWRKPSRVLPIRSRQSLRPVGDGLVRYGGHTWSCHAIRIIGMALPFHGSRMRRYVSVHGCTGSPSGGRASGSDVRFLRQRHQINDPTSAARSDLFPFAAKAVVARMV